MKKYYIGRPADAYIHNKVILTRDTDKGRLLIVQNTLAEGYLPLRTHGISKTKM
jgi:hypothetical protein